MASGWIWIHQLPNATSGTSSERADQAILRAYQGGKGQFESGDHSSAPPLSRSQLQKLIESGALTCAGHTVRSSEKLPAGAHVRLAIPAPRTLELIPEYRPIEILFEDEHLAVINKPAGLTVHPSETQHEGTLVHILLHRIKDLSGIGGVLRPGIVHRLDKNTSGALVISKTDAAHQKLVEIFSEHRLERRYWALCYGRFAAPARIEGSIGRNPQDRKKMAMNVKGGREAVTHVRSLAHYGAHACWIEAMLETGRTHQVRVHLTAHGNSLLGDPVYGTPTSKNTKWTVLPPRVQAAVREIPGQALHARVLGFEHPITGQAHRFEAEPPQAWLALRQALEETV